MAKQTFTVGQVLTAAQMTSLQQTAMGGGSTTAKTTSYVLVAADAGTVVQMNAAGATTITVNTALFAAGDTVQIQNIGAGVCTVTAGTATVTTAGSLALSQWEGGQLYFTATSSAIFFDIVQSSGMTNPLTTTGDTIYSSSGTTAARLGIGSTGQVLTVAGGVPSWATTAASGLKSMTLLNAGGTALTAAATITISGISSQQALMVLVSGASSVSASSGISIILNADSGTNYNFMGVLTQYANNLTKNSIGDNYIHLGNLSSNAASTISGALMIYGTTSTSGYMPFQYAGMSSAGGGTGQNGYAHGGLYTAAAAITSLSIKSDTGNFDAGTIYVYGMAS